MPGRHYATGPASIIQTLIALVQISATDPVAILSLGNIRANFFDIFGCARHNSNKFGFALACTKFVQFVGNNISSHFYCARKRQLQVVSSCSCCRHKKDTLIGLGVKCLEGTTERSDGNRGRSPRICVTRMTCLEGTTPQDM